MPALAINPTYLVDTSGQQWQLIVTDSGQPSAIAVFGQSAVPYLLINDSVTTQVWKLTIVPSPPPAGYAAGDIRIDVVGLAANTSQILLSSPGGRLFNLIISSGILGTVATTAPPAPISDQPIGPFNVIRLTAVATYVGGVCGNQNLPCSPRDEITLTASIRYLSGPNRPTIGVWFWDAGQTNCLGSIQISPPSTDNQWHNYSVTGIVPAGAGLLVVATIPEPLIAGRSYFVGSMPDPAGPYGPVLTSSISTTWEISNFRITQNNNAIYAPINTFRTSTVNGAISSLTLLTAGTGYAIGDLINIIQAGGGGAQLQVTAIGGGGSVSATTKINSGQGYTVDPTGATTSTTTTGAGTPLSIGINAVSIIPMPAAVVVYLQEFIYPLYYLSLLTSQYQAAPNLYAWLSVLLAPTIDLFDCTQQEYRSFDIDLASGTQLDTLGTIIGASRVLPFQPSGGASPLLTDSDYKILLRGKIAQNQWNGSIGSLYTLWNQLFPGGSISIIDNQDMTASIILAGTFTSVAKDMILNGLIVPRPEGVLYNYLFVTLPVLGFDQVNSNVAGLDLGHFA